VSSRMDHSAREVHDPLVVDRVELTRPQCAIATLSPYGEEACWRFVFVDCNHRAEPVAVRLLRLQGCAGQSVPLATEGETAPRAAAPLFSLQSAGRWVSRRTGAVRQHSIVTALAVMPNSEVTDTEGHRVRCRLRFVWRRRCLS